MAKRNKSKKEWFNLRDFIGFILFTAIILVIFYAIKKEAENTVFICLTVIAGIIFLFWLSPTIKELIVVYKEVSLKVKQGGRKR